ncbi:MAG TPA: serine/threonine-protein kinase [Ktedonobacteraceae bacterium]|nr:serine/threonine-protein kinase [Ktedonobacteraceae bacterium]
MADLTGQQFGVYRVIQPLGRGGYGATYLGEHIHLKNQVLIKTLPAGADGRETQNFINQARLLAKVSHPNIVHILDFGEQGDTYFIVTDYAPGGSLRQRHPRGSRVPLNTVVSYVRQVASALQYAHDQGIVHRDVRPEHMLVGRKGEILLSGFDIAVASRTMISASGMPNMAGAMAYIAPEQVMGEKPRPASDQYALGVVIYEWLSGDVPFHGKPMEVAMQHLHTPPLSLRMQMPEISPEVEEVVMIALNKNPQKRFGSVRAFANAFEQASRIGQAKAGGPSPLPPEDVPAVTVIKTFSRETDVISPGSRREEISTPSLQQGQPAYPATPAVGGFQQNTTPLQQWGQQQYPATPPAQAQRPYPTTSPPPSPAPPPGARPAKSSRGSLSSFFSEAGSALERLFSDRGKQKAQESLVSLFAIARATLEPDNRAITGKTYTAQVGIAQSVPERFQGASFDVPVRDMTEPLWFDIVIHASENIELMGEWHKRLRYDLRNANPQLVEFFFRLRTPGSSSFAITFYHERRWLQTVRLEFEGVQTSTFTTVAYGG